MQKIPGIKSVIINYFIVAGNIFALYVIFYLMLRKNIINPQGLVIVSFFILYSLFIIIKKSSYELDKEEEEVVLKPKNSIIFIILGIILEKLDFILLPIINLYTKMIINCYFLKSLIPENLIWKKFITIIFNIAILLLTLILIEKITLIGVDKSKLENIVGIVKFISGSFLILIMLILNFFIPDFN